MPAPRKYDEETRARAVRMYTEAVVPDQRSRVARETCTGVPNGPGWLRAETARISLPRCLVLGAGDERLLVRP